MGKLWYFLGIEVARSWIGINLSQRKYVLDLLNGTWLLGVRLVDVSMNPNKKLLKDEGELFEDLGRYCILVGKLNYLTITKPDISYAISIWAYFWEHLESHNRMLSFAFLIFEEKPLVSVILYRKNGHIRVKGFTDAHWARSPLDRRSTERYCIFFVWNFVT